MAALWTRTRDDLLAYWRQALVFHLLVQLISVALFTPLVSLAANRLVAGSGDYVITNFDLASFALSLRGIAFILVSAALTVGLLLAEFTGLSWIAGHAIARRPIRAVSAVAVTARLLPRLIRLATRIFLRLVALLLPFLAATGLLWLATLTDHDINFYLSEEPPEWRRAMVIVGALLACYGLLAAWQLARWLFAVPVALFEGAPPAPALKRSAQLTRGRLLAVTVPLLVWWVLLTALTTALTWLARQGTAPALAWAGIDVHRVLPLVAVFLACTTAGGFLYGAVGLAGHQFLLTRMYAEHPEVRWTLTPAEAFDEHRARSIARPVFVAAIAFAALALGIGALLFLRLDVKTDVAVTAHRGASLHAPENTMAAFRAALDAGSDYVELDVQRTRDGAVVVIHDGDLMRLGGDPRKVRDLTLADLAGIDIGRRYSERFAGEHVPTLQDVIALARGRMKLNIELKYNVPDPDLAPAVVDLLRHEDFLDQVVITSLDYQALKQVKAIEPRLVTGHIVTAAVGNVARTTADFVSLNSAKATPSLVRRAHAAGKAVHVWTVDKPEVMLRMIERGVDNIITNDPARLKLVMQERRALSRPEILGLRLRILFSEPPPEVETATAVPEL